MSIFALKAEATLERLKSIMEQSQTDIIVSVSGYSAISLFFSFFLMVPTKKKQQQQNILEYEVSHTRAKILGVLRGREDTGGAEVSAR